MQQIDSENLTQKLRDIYEGLWSQTYDEGIGYSHEVRIDTRVDRSYVKVIIIKINET